MLGNGVITCDMADLSEIACDGIGGVPDGFSEPSKAKAKLAGPIREPIWTFRLRPPYCA